MKLRALAVCIGAGAILLLAACTSDDTATTSPTDEPTANEEAASSPTPTGEPTPTATSDAALEAVETYFENLVVWLEEGARLTSGVVEIAGSDNPLSSSNETKALGLTAAADAWRDDALTFDAPSSLSEVQMWVELAGVAIAGSLEDFWLGITLADVDLINSAIEQMDLGNEYLGNANELLIAGP